MAEPPPEVIAAAAAARADMQATARSNMTSPLVAYFEKNPMHMNQIMAAHKAGFIQSSDIINLVMVNGQPQWNVEAFRSSTLLPMLGDIIRDDVTRQHNAKNEGVTSVLSITPDEDGQYDVVYAQIRIE